MAGVLIGRNGRGYEPKHITVRISKSKEFGEQGWRTIELSTHAELSPGADASYERNKLYEELKRDLEALFQPWEVKSVR